MYAYMCVCVCVCERVITLYKDFKLNNNSLINWLINWMIDIFIDLLILTASSTYLELFYDEGIVHIYVFGILAFLEFFCTQFYDIKYSYLIQIICSQFYGFKYSYLIQIICTQFYGFKYSYLI